MKSIIPIITLGILALCAGSAFATRSSQSDRTIREYFGLAFDDGTVVLVSYPDSTERPLSDVQERFKAAWQWFQLPPK